MTEFSTDFLAELLRVYGVELNPDVRLLRKLDEHQTESGDSVALFTYRRHRFMALSDQRKSSSPEAVRAVFESEILIPSEGYLLTVHALPTIDQYAYSVGGSNFYLWSYDQDE